MPFGLPTPSLLPTLPALSPSPIGQHTPKITARLTVKTVTPVVNAIARSWNRPLLWIALPLAIVGHDPANAQMMPNWLNRDLAVPIKPGGRGCEMARFGAGRGVSLSVVTQAIEAAPQGRDRSMPDRVVRFEPPTDDDIGETGSGATRSLCVGMFALRPLNGMKQGEWVGVYGHAPAISSRLHQSIPSSWESTFALDRERHATKV
jgi:hypothetical protein